ncbi:MAG: PepSY domain-containing protein [Gaiellaceae bacterium MAG52_C11]|nr:PepSY domain-containing protein [Candidatus Gaiellasilicea maunaloa]
MSSRLTKIAAGVAALTAFALGGAALAGATGGDDSDGADRELTGATLQRASAAALRATGGGTVNETERDSENGAVYEVEVTKPNRSTVDVRLDESFSVVAIEGDGNEDEGARDG